MYLRLTVTEQLVIVSPAATYVLRPDVSHIPIISISFHKGSTETIIRLRSPVSFINYTDGVISYDPGTVTCVDSVEVDAEFVAVSIYVVVLVGFTTIESVRLTLPIPLSIITLFAPVTFQTNTYVVSLVF